MASSHTLTVGGGCRCKAHLGHHSSLGLSSARSCHSTASSEGEGKGRGGSVGPKKESKADIEETDCATQRVSPSQSKGEGTDAEAGELDVLQIV